MLKGIHVANASTKTGRTWYVYAWRGGPCIYKVKQPKRPKALPPEAITAFEAAHAQRRQPRNIFLKLIRRFQKDKLRAYRPATQKNWGRWLHKIEDRYGELALSEISTPAMIDEVQEWHDELSTQTPREADFMLQVMSRLCTFGIARRLITHNPVVGIETAYKADRAAIIWTESDLKKLKNHVNPATFQVVQLAALTGLRLADCLTLRWDEITDMHIVKATSKSGETVDALIEITKPLRAFLNDLSRQGDTVLTTARKKPWTNAAFQSRFGKGKRDAGIKGLHFHDLRGTYITHLYAVGKTHAQIAETTGWSEKKVGQILRHYVDMKNVVALREARAVK